MIFEERYNQNGGQTIADGENLLTYAAKQTKDDLEKLVGYSAGMTPAKLKKLEELNAPTSTYVCSNLISSVPEGAKSFASLADFSEAMGELRQAYSTNTNTKTPFRHFIVSIAENEHLTNRRWRRVVNELMGELGFTHSAYIVFKHSDTKNEHVHIVTSNVNQLTGKVVNDFQSHTRAQTVMRRMEDAYVLTKVKSSNDMDYGEGDVNDANQHKAKAKMRRLVDEVILSNKGEMTMNEFMLALVAKGIDIKLTVNKSNANRFKGISYSDGQYKFSGSAFNKHNKYTLGGLIKHQVLREDSKLVCNYIEIDEDEKAMLLANNRDKEIRESFHINFEHEVRSKQAKILINANAKTRFERKAATDANRAMKEWNNKRDSIMRLTFHTNNVKHTEEWAERLRAKRQARKLKNLLEVMFYIEAQSQMSKDMRRASSILADILCMILESKRKDYKIDFISKDDYKKKFYKTKENKKATELIK